jgi:two-component system NarL family sensor kinase
MKEASTDELFMIQIFFAAILIIMVFVVALLVFLVKNRNRKNSDYMEKQQVLRDHQKLLLEEQERVLNTVSVHVHDQLGQALNLMRVHLHGLDHLPLPIREGSILHEAANLCEQMIRNTKHISYLLNSDYVMVHGLQALLNMELERINKHYKILGKLICGEDRLIINPETQLIIFRIAQEALQNVVQHSGAQHVTILIEDSEIQFGMQIIDNGTGFGAERISTMPGLGLNNMRNRAMLINGELDIQSLPSNGTSVTLKIIHPKS